MKGNGESSRCGVSGLCTKVKESGRAREGVPVLLNVRYIAVDEFSMQVLKQHDYVGVSEVEVLVVYGSTEDNEEEKARLWGNLGRGLYRIDDGTECVYRET